MRHVEKENEMVRTPSTMLPLGTEAEGFLLTNVDGRSLSFSEIGRAHV